MSVIGSLLKGLKKPAPAAPAPKVDAMREFEARARSLNLPTTPPIARPRNYSETPTVYCTTSDHGMRYLYQTTASSADEKKKR